MWDHVGFLTRFFWKKRKNQNKTHLNNTKPTKIYGFVTV